MKDVRRILSAKAGPDAQGCLVIAEVAQAHDGSLGLAHAYIDAIAQTGADAVKFQTHIAAAESTAAEQWRVKFSRQDATRYDYWKRMEFSESQWRELKQHADERGLLFLSSPFSLEAVEMLTRVGVAAWKVASGETASVTLFDRMAATKLPLLISTGMSPWKEIDALVGKIKNRDVSFALLQCTTAYPCPPEKIGLNILEEFRRRYDCPVGLSDHSGTIYPGLAAVAQGAAVVEVHVTLSREMFGPDVIASVTSAELKQLVEGVRFIEKMRAHPLDKDESAAQTKTLRQMFGKSIVARADLPAGTVLRAEHVTMKKPGSGLPEEKLSVVLNRKLRKDVPADGLILEESFE